MDTTWSVCLENVYYCLLYGMDLLNISWSFVTMCVYHDGSGILHGDFIITCLWKYLKT